jgi:hypothetical protein
MSTPDKLNNQSDRIVGILEKLEQNRILANIFTDSSSRPSMLNNSVFNESYGYINYYVVELPSDEDQDLYRNEFSDDEFGEDDEMTQPTVNVVCEKMPDVRTIYYVVISFNFRMIPKNTHKESDQHLCFVIRSIGVRSTMKKFLLKFIRGKHFLKKK